MLATDLCITRWSRRHLQAHSWGLSIDTLPKTVRYRIVCFALIDNAAPHCAQILEATTKTCACTLTKARCASYVRLLPSARLRPSCFRWFCRIGNQTAQFRRHGTSPFKLDGPLPPA